MRTVRRARMEGRQGRGGSRFLSFKTFAYPLSVAPYETPGLGRRVTSGHFAASFA